MGNMTVAFFFDRKGICPNCKIIQMERAGIPSNHCYVCPDKPWDVQEAVDIALHFKPRKSYWGTVCPECHEQVPNLLGKNKFMCIYCRNIIDVDEAEAEANQGHDNEVICYHRPHCRGRLCVDYENCERYNEVYDKYLIKEPQATKVIIKDRGSMLEFK